MTQDEFVEILSTTDPTQIALIKSVLEREKILYVAQGEIHSAIDTRLPVGFLVPLSQRERAAKALKDFL